MADQGRESQPAELSTGERLATTGRAVAQGVAHRIKGEHETTGGAALTVLPGEARRLIESWPAPQRAVAEQMLSRYGDPNEGTPTRLTWYRNGPWKRTEITSDVVEHHWPAPHSDFLTQTIDYRVPPERVSDVVAFDGSILVDRTKGEVSARCDSEAANVLGLNMVHEIATGRRTTDDARRISQENTVAYNLGRDAPYAERLLFEVPDSGTEDMDSSAVGGAIARQVAGKVADAAGHRSEPTDRRTP